MPEANNQDPVVSDAYEIIAGLICDELGRYAGGEIDNSRIMQQTELSSDIHRDNVVNFLQMLSEFSASRARETR